MLQLSSSVLCCARSCSELVEALPEVPKLFK
jgi:hypothetical protein